MMKRRVKFRNTWIPVFPALFLLTGLMMTVLLSGCGNAKTIQAPEPLPEEETADIQQSASNDPQEEEDGDRLLSSVSATVEESRTLRLDAIGKMRPDMAGHCGIREIRVYDGGRLLQTIQANEASGSQTGALGAGYAESPSVEQALSVHDMNFDGSDDIDLTGWLSARSEPHHYWLWNSSLDRYIYAFTFENVELDTENQEIIVTGHDGGVSYVEHYRYENGLTPLSRQIEDWDNGTEDFPLRAYYEYPDGEETLMWEEFTDYDDEGRTIREVRERVYGEMHLVRLEELEVTDGVERVIRTEEIAVPEPPPPEEPSEQSPEISPEPGQMNNTPDTSE